MARDKEYERYCRDFDDFLDLVCQQPTTEQGKVAKELLIHWHVYDANILNWQKVDRFGNVEKRRQSGGG